MACFTCVIRKSNKHSIERNGTDLFDINTSSIQPNSLGSVYFIHTCRCWLLLLLLFLNASFPLFITNFIPPNATFKGFSFVIYFRTHSMLNVNVWVRDGRTCVCVNLLGERRINELSLSNVYQLLSSKQVKCVCSSNFKVFIYISNYQTKEKEESKEKRWKTKSLFTMIMCWNQSNASNTAWFLSHLSVHSSISAWNSISG